MNNNDIFRSNIEVDGYYFTGYSKLTFHSGTFWINNIEQKIVYNNGSKSVLLYGYSKKSIKKLRKLAKPCKIII